MADPVFPDNTVLCNFASVHRLDLLESFLRGRGRWTEAVHFEARNSARFLPDLADLIESNWLGDPIELTDEADIQAIERLRLDVFGGVPSRASQHLGEAQTCYLLKEVAEFRGGWWVSDDKDSLGFARTQGITTLETIEIVKHVVADGDLTAADGFDLLTSMTDQGRHLRLPTSVNDLHH